jgi:hypothetical protein
MGGPKMTVDPALTRWLGERPPKSVAALDAESQARLAELIANARRKQAGDLEAAFEATLHHVPFPIRGLVKRTLL